MPLSSVAEAALRGSDLSNKIPNCILIVPPGMMASALDALWREADKLGWGICLQNDIPALLQRLNGSPLSAQSDRRILVVITDPVEALRHASHYALGAFPPNCSVVLMWDGRRKPDALLEIHLIRAVWRRVEMVAPDYTGPYGVVLPPIALPYTQPTGKIRKVLGKLLLGGRLASKNKVR